MPRACLTTVCVPMSLCSNAARLAQLAASPLRLTFQPASLRVQPFPLCLWGTPPKEPHCHLHTLAMSSHLGPRTCSLLPLIFWNCFLKCHQYQQLLIQFFPSIPLCEAMTTLSLKRFLLLPHQRVFKAFPPLLAGYTLCSESWTSYRILSGTYESNPTLSSSPK